MTLTAENFLGVKPTPPDPIQEKIPVRQFGPVPENLDQILAQILETLERIEKRQQEGLQGIKDLRPPEVRILGGQ